jgi:hypothetical protein
LLDRPLRDGTDGESSSRALFCVMKRRASEDEEDEKMSNQARNKAKKQNTKEGTGERERERERQSKINNNTKPSALRESVRTRAQGGTRESTKVYFFVINSFLCPRTFREYVNEILKERIFLCGAAASFRRSSTVLS